MSKIDYHSLAGQVFSSVGDWLGDVLSKGEHPPSFIQLNYDTSKNRAGKVQVYLHFISPFFFLYGDDNPQFFLGFGRKIFANLYFLTRTTMLTESSRQKATA